METIKSTQVNLKPVYIFQDNQHPHLFFIYCEHKIILFGSNLPLTAWALPSWVLKTSKDRPSMTSLVNVSESLTPCKKRFLFYLAVTSLFSICVYCHSFCHNEPLRRVQLCPHSALSSSEWGEGGERGGWSCPEDTSAPISTDPTLLSSPYGASTPV